MTMEILAHEQIGSSDTYRIVRLRRFVAAMHRTVDRITKYSMYGLDLLQYNLARRVRWTCSKFKSQDLQYSTVHYCTQTRSKESVRIITAMLRLPAGSTFRDILMGS